MKRRVLRILIGLSFIVFAIYKLVQTVDFYWVALIVAGLMYIYRGIKDKDQI